MTFYEQVGIVIPGSVFLVGLLFYFPALYALIAKEGVTLGQFGIFLLLSYAAGQLLAAVGNALEAVLWKIAGGMPSDWVTHESTSLLTAAQVESSAGKARSRLGSTIEKIPGTPARTWFPISRQMYADVAKNGKAERIETFNGNYGLNRGLAAAMLALAVISLPQREHALAGGFIVIALMYLYRAYRFAKHYARELYVQFLVLSDAPAPESVSMAGLHSENREPDRLGRSNNTPGRRLDAQ